MRMAVPHMHRAELYRDLACPVRSLNMILICSIYSVTAVLTDFIVEPSMCQTFLHSFYFPVLLIARKLMLLWRCQTILQLLLILAEILQVNRSPQIVVCHIQMGN